MVPPKKKIPVKGKASAAKGKPPAKKPAPTKKVPAARKASGKPAEPVLDEEEELEEEVESAELEESEAEEADEPAGHHPGRAAVADLEAKAKKSSGLSEETPTEELWILYRKEASKRGVKDPRHLDELRNT